MQGLELLERRICFSSIDFVERILFEGRVGEFAVADIDGDKDLDIVSLAVGDDGVAGPHWLENRDGEFVELKIVGAGPRSTLFVGDLDGDGDLDVVSGKYLFYEGELAWYENLDGKANFSAKKVIAQGQNQGANDVVGADFDLDGDLDLFVVSQWSDDPEFERYQSRIVWYENIDGIGGFVPHEIGSEAKGMGKLHITDINGDGLPDVSSTIAWFRNTGEGDFDQLDAPVGILPVASGDIDGDGDVDSFAIDVNDETTLWLQNDGNGEFGVTHRIDKEFRPRTGVVVDIDLDGDLDVVSGTCCKPIGTPTPIVWYENTDGQGKFERQIVDDNFGTVFLSAADLEGDMDQDLIVVGRGRTTIRVYENLLVPTPGDANRDGVFDSGDLVQIFQAGEYEDGIGGNSTFEEGDFDQDGDFTTRDLVFAFANGSYVQNALIAAAMDDINRIVHANQRKDSARNVENE